MFSRIFAKNSTRVMQQPEQYYHGKLEEVTALLKNHKQKRNGITLVKIIQPQVRPKRATRRDIAKNEREAGKREREIPSYHGKDIQYPCGNGDYRENIQKRRDPTGQ